MAKQKFYAVWRGRVPGVYDSWLEAEAQISGFKHARYKSYPTLIDAAEAFGEGPPLTKADTAYEKAKLKAQRVSSSKPPPKTKATKAPNNPPKRPLATPPRTVIFCDGAAEPNPGETGTGLAIYRDDTLIELHYGLYLEYGTNNIGELNGIIQALKLAEPYCKAGETVRIKADSDYAIKATSEWSYSWKTQNWKRGKAPVKNLALVQKAHALYDTLRSQVEIVHVKAHSGVEGNELADRMAMLAIAKEKAALVRYEGVLDVPAILRLQTG